MNEEFEQVLLGSLLGDGSIRKHDNKIKDDNFEFYEGHSIKQKEYSLWKKSILEKHLILKYYENIKHDKNNNKDYREVHIYSIGDNKEILKKYYYIFGLDNNKTITEKILNKLTLLGIVVWYCDDGCFVYGLNYIKIATCCFSLEEHNKIIYFFKEKYNIKFKIQETKYKNRGCGGRRDHYYLSLSVQETKKFINLIENYVPECMSYKLGKDKDKNKLAKKRIDEYYKNNDNRNRIKKKRRERYIKNRKNLK